MNALRLNGGKLYTETVSDLFFAFLEPIVVGVVGGVVEGLDVAVAEVVGEDVDDVRAWGGGACGFCQEQAAPDTERM